MSQSPNAMSDAIAEAFYWTYDSLLGWSLNAKSSTAAQDAE
jgi:hypothetical protein